MSSEESDRFKGFFEAEEGKAQRRFQEPNEERRLDLESKQLDIKRRRRYSSFIPWVFAIWLLCTLATIIIEGFGLWGFDLPETVLIALVAASSGSVVSLLLIVARYLFSRPKGGS